MRFMSCCFLATIFHPVVLLLVYKNMCLIHIFHYTYRPLCLVPGSALYCKNSPHISAIVCCMYCDPHYYMLLYR